MIGHDTRVRSGVQEARTFVISIGGTMYALDGLNACMGSREAYRGILISMAFASGLRLVYTLDSGDESTELTTRQLR